jgi:hypothetical protein
MTPSRLSSVPLRGIAAISLVIATAAVLPAAQPKEPGTDLEQKAFFKPELSISTSHAPLGVVLMRLPNRGAWEGFLAQQGDDARQPRLKAWLDPRSGAATNVMGAFPLIPGRGVGNQLTLHDLATRFGRPVSSVDEPVVAEAVRRFAQSQRLVLAIDVKQLGGARTTKVSDDLWQVSIPQVYADIPVRDARLVATINHGNLVVVGTEVWGNVRGLNATPTLQAADAVQAGFLYADGRAASDVVVREPALEIVPVAPQEMQDGAAYTGSVGAGYGHRLVWTFVFQRIPEEAQWEVMVDAHSGEVIAFQDLNRYENRQIKGGVYPLTSTGICPNPGQCGEMKSGWPMPFADTGLAFPNDFTNGAGIFNWTGGPVSTTLTGRYVDIVDGCGLVNESSPAGTLDLGGVNDQHDCTSAGTSAGDTASSRSAFYEVNKLFEQARGWLPTNAWLQSRLQTRLNLNNTCNAFWDGTSINFYRSGGGCRNSGELAGVFDHEWGHGLDDNDANGALSNSSEAYADIAAIYRLQSSCVGYGFFETSDQGCGQTADLTGFNVNEAQVGAAHCDLDCSGVRDTDWDKHTDHTPDTALGFVCSSCQAGTGPCGRQVHCAAAPVRQAAWDLAARDLQAPPYNYDSQTAFIVANRIFYQGSGNVGSWHACTCGVSSSGCGATNGYMQWLAADDDNGNLNDGTPHMTALFNAFNRHGIACSSPTAQNSGCGGGPTEAPTLTAIPDDYAVALSWTAVAGATRYWVFRTEGHAGRDFGKARIAEVAGTSFTDTGVANGRTYYYNVVAAGGSSACYGPAGAGMEATPAPPTGPNFSVSCAPSVLTVTQGGSAGSTCTVSSTNGFNTVVDLSCSGLPTEVSCAFNPNPVTPPADQTVGSALTVTATTGALPGNFAFQVRGTGGGLTRNANLQVTVNPTGGGPQTAVYDPLLRAPRCAAGSSCDSGTLVNGRDGRGPEPNQPNTINGSCEDGTLGTYHSAESNDRVKVSTLDGTVLMNGKTVRIDATVWAWTGGPSSDKLDLYYAANAASPVWTYITTLTPAAGGVQTLSATYNLPAGDLQAVRARFRYQGSVTPCQPGGFDDHDDLIFAVTPSTDTTPPTTSITSPTDGATVSGTVTVNAAASDDAGVAKVEFYVDGALKGTDTSAPYQFSWITGSVPNGSHTLQSRAYDAVNNVGASDIVTVIVNNPVVVAAAYDPVLRAPRCSGAASGCDSGALVNGRDGKGPEPNQPNTINNSCADSTGGTYHFDESVDRIRVVTTDGSALAAGKTVRVETTVWAFSPPTGDRLDLYYAANAASPTWTFLTTLTPPGGGARTLTATYTLPAGALQAVRAQFRYQGFPSTCTVGAYNDRDDLVFAVP